MRCDAKRTFLLWSVPPSAQTQTIESATEISAGLWTRVTTQMGGSLDLLVVKRKRLVATSCRHTDGSVLLMGIKG